MPEDIEKLIQANEKLVYHVINKKYPALAYDDDIYQVGLIGLWKACKNFDASKNCKLSSFACLCIEREIILELRYRARNQFSDSISLDEPLYNNEDNTESLMFAEFVPSQINPYSEIECDLSFLEGKISDKNLDILRCVVRGGTSTTIGEMYNCSRQRGHTMIQNARKAAQQYIQKEDLL